MENKELSALKELEYTKLNREQEEKIRNYENEFNAIYSKECYFMIMDRTDDRS